MSYALCVADRLTPRELEGLFYTLMYGGKREVPQIAVFSAQNSGGGQASRNFRVYLAYEWRIFRSTRAISLIDGGWFAAMRR